MLKKTKWTILKAISILYLLFCFGYMALNYSVLVSGESYGMVAIIIMIVFGFIGLGLDFVLGLIIKNKLLLNIIGAGIAFLYFLWLWPRL